MGQLCVKKLWRGGRVKYDSTADCSCARPEHPDAIEETRMTTTHQLCKACTGVLAPVLSAFCVAGGLLFGAV